MNVLLVSSGPDAGLWAVQMHESECKVTTVTSITELTQIPHQDWHCVLIEADAGLNQAKLDLLDAALDLGVDVFFKFAPNTFLTGFHQKVIKLGAAGIFVGWPTYFLLEYETVTRKGDITFRHPKHGVIEIRGKELYAHGKKIRVTLREKDIFRLVCKGRVNGREVSMSDIKRGLGLHASMRTHTIETHVYRLRDKLKEVDLEGLIGNTQGVGYFINMS